MQRAGHPVGRQEWIDGAKGAAIVLVVLYHCTLYLGAEGISGLPAVSKVGLELFPMPAFFLVAGVLALRAADYSFAELWRRRLLPLLYLYVLWSAIRFAFYVALPMLEGGLGELPANSAVTLALIFVWPSSSYWFLYALALFTFVGWATRRFAIATIAAATLLSVAVTSGLVDTGNGGWNRVLALLVFYLLGMRFSRLITARVASSTGWTAAGAAGVLGVVAAALVVLRLRDIPGIVFVGQIAALATGIVLVRLLLHAPGAKTLRRWGAASLQIYLLHLFVIVPIAAAVGYLPWRPPRGVGLVMELGLTVVAILASLLIARWTARVRWLYLPPSTWTRPRRRHAPVSTSSAVHDVRPPELRSAP